MRVRGGGGRGGNKECLNWTGKVHRERLGAQRLGAWRLGSGKLGSWRLGAWSLGSGKYRGAEINETE